MKLTEYTVFAKWEDAIKLYRAALKKGYSYGTIEPAHENDEVQVVKYGKRTYHKQIQPPRWEESKEFGCKVYIPAQTEEIITHFGIEMRYKSGGKYVPPSYRYQPKALVYRNYSSKTLLAPDFELYKVTLAREY